ncbi:hypothetical protein NQT74_10845 [Alteromonas stellipolaris]|uniref:hypothetical protein n=1 Tax=Alteromonas stellipolaris TaxID=233316 RepID=UPI002119AA4D|nr:hypothetical protein [Alteromonas stellipolaris]MCQ8849078.1 hypothetical protein [Alteromonas stellipolaris]
MLTFRRALFKLVILSLFASNSIIAASEENTAILISFQKIKLNNKNKPLKHTLTKLWGSYELIAVKTGQKVIIENRHYVNKISLEAGIYCLVSGGSQSIVNPACFEAYEGAVTSTGTWTIGYRMESHAEFSAIVSIKDNFAEQAEDSEISSYRPTTFFNYDDVIKAFSQEKSSEDKGQ